VAIAAPTASDLPFNGQFGSIVYVDRNLFFSAGTKCTSHGNALCNGARVVLSCVRAQNAYAVTCLVARLVPQAQGRPHPQVQGAHLQVQEAHPQVQEAHLQVQGARLHVQEAHPQVQGAHFQVQGAHLQATTLAVARQQFENSARDRQRPILSGPTTTTTTTTTGGLVSRGPAAADNDRASNKLYLAVVLSTGFAYSFATLIAQTQTALPFDGQFGSCVFVRFNAVKSKVDNRAVRVGDFLLITRITRGRLGLRVLECSVVT
jgi:hypothetical protein